MAAVAQVTICPRDPGVETALRCSRCESPICPKCLVMSPVGARCKSCARVMKSPIYTLQPKHYVRAGLACLVGGTIMGVIWGLVLLPFTYGFFSIFVGAALGYAFTRLLDFATGRKRGPIVVGFASAGIVLAWGISLAFASTIGLYGLVAVGIGIYFAYQRLRAV